jgi:hypothetical protein
MKVYAIVLTVVMALSPVFVNAAPGGIPGPPVVPPVGVPPVLPPPPPGLPPAPFIPPPFVGGPPTVPPVTPPGPPVPPTTPPTVTSTTKAAAVRGTKPPTVWATLAKVVYNTPFLIFAVLFYHDLTTPYPAAFEGQQWDTCANPGAPKQCYEKRPLVNAFGKATGGSDSDLH